MKILVTLKEPVYNAPGHYFKNTYEAANLLVCDILEYNDKLDGFKLIKEGVEIAFVPKHNLLATYNLKES